MIGSTCDFFFFLGLFACVIFNELFCVQQRHGKDGRPLITCAHDFFVCFVLFLYLTRCTFHIQVFKCQRSLFKKQVSHWFLFIFFCHFFFLDFILSRQNICSGYFFVLSSNAHRLSPHVRLFHTCKFTYFLSLRRLSRSRDLRDGIFFSASKASVIRLKILCIFIYTIAYSRELCGLTRQLADGITSIRSCASSIIAIEGVRSGFSSKRHFRSDAIFLSIILFTRMYFEHGSRFGWFRQIVSIEQMFFQNTVSIPVEWPDYRLPRVNHLEPTKQSSSFGLRRHSYTGPVSGY